MDLCPFHSRGLRVGRGHIVCEAETGERSSQHGADNKHRYLYPYDNSRLFVGKERPHPECIYGRRRLDSGEPLPYVESGVHVSVGDRLMALVAGCPGDTSNCRIMRMDSGRVFL